MKARSLATRALCLLATLAAAATGQSPVAVKTTLFPACSDRVAAVGDFDGSGLPDLVEATLGSPPALKTIHDPGVAGGGACQTTPITQVPSSMAILAVFPANLNGDAYPDLVVAVHYQWVLDALGDGAGGFTIPGTGAYASPATSSALAVLVRDLNSDGRDDVVVQRSATQTVEVFLNLATGWSSSFSYVTPVQSQCFGAGDVNGDGIVDLVWVETLVPFLQPPVPNGSQLRIARGVGNGTFTMSAPTVPVGYTGALQLAVGDLDLDGKDDVIVSPPSIPFGTGQPMAVVFGTAAPALPVATPVASPFGALLSSYVVDFDRDGIPDIVQESEGNGTGTRSVLFVRGLGARQFAPAFVLGADAVAFPLIQSVLFAADADGDQDVDVFRMSANVGTPLGSLQLYRNETVFAPGCAGSAGVVPAISVGMAHPGNATFAIGVGSALPGAPAVLGVSLARSAIAGCGVALNLGLAHMLVPTSSVGVTTTDATGAASLVLPIPSAGIAGLAVYAQWGVLDPAGTLPFEGQPFAATQGRTILVW